MCTKTGSRPRIAIFVRLALVALLVTGAALPRSTRAQALPDGVMDASFATPAGERVLHLSATVDAPIARAWAAFATDDGFRAWAVPLAKIDLRVGGSIESSYDANVPLGSGRTIRNEIVSLVPQRVLVIRNVQAPPGVPFDVGAFQTIQTAMLFEPLDGNRTRVTVMSGAFADGERWDGVYRFFRAGNAYTLAELRKHFALAPGASRQ
jgi:uncharacterized protein YndB with AHSA1/START domain